MMKLRGWATKLLDNERKAANEAREDLNQAKVLRTSILTFSFSLY